MIRGDLAIAVERDGILTPVTRYASGLEFRKTAPGGHADLQVTLALPGVGWNLGPTDRVVVTSTATADTVWEGYIEWPTPVDANGLRYYTLTALGGQVLLTDTIRPVYYADRHEIMGGDKWQKRTLNTPGGDAEVSTLPGATSDTPAAVVKFPEGSVAAGKQIALAYDAPYRADRTLYRFGLSLECGVTEPDVEAQVVGRAGGVSTVVTNLTFGLSTSPRTGRNGWVGDSTLPSGQSSVWLRLRNTSGSPVTGMGDDAWAAWYFMHATASLLRLDGSWRAYGDYPNPGNFPAIRTDMIVEDLLARHLGDLIDVAGATVDAGVHEIDQFTIMDGARDSDVLDSLALWEPDLLWEVGPRNGAGKHTFAYRAWPTEARYILGSKVAFTESGANIDLCNRVAVRWKTENGNDQFTYVTTTVPELGTRVRDADPVDISDGFGSTGNAVRIGQKVLAAKNADHLTGVAMVSTPIFDRVLGRMVEPWEILPGYMAQLQASGDVLRVTEVSYSDDSATTALTLGELSDSLEQSIARLPMNSPRVTRKKARNGRMGKGILIERKKKKKKGRGR